MSLRVFKKCLYDLNKTVFEMITNEKEAHPNNDNVSISLC